MQGASHATSIYSFFPELLAIFSLHSMQSKDSSGEQMPTLKRLINSCYTPRVLWHRLKWKGQSQEEKDEALKKIVWATFTGRRRAEARALSCEGADINIRGDHPIAEWIKDENLLSASTQLNYHKAFDEGRAYDFIEFLLQHGIDANAPVRSSNEKPYHALCSAKNTRFARLLVAYGAVPKNAHCGDDQLIGYHIKQERWRAGTPERFKEMDERIRYLIEQGAELDADL